MFGKFQLRLVWGALLSMLLLLVPFAGAQDADLAGPTGPVRTDAFKLSRYPAIGSYFGIATQVCAQTDNSCPKIALFMTPTLLSDGTFIGNDSLSLGGAPFGPHTTAHGQWVPITSTEFIADYTFMLPTPPPSTAIVAPRFRWDAKVIDTDTIVGFVNIYLFPPIPVNWTSLSVDQFPTLPSEALNVITPPGLIVTDPSRCQGPACPLVFKFTVKRVSPNQL